MQIDAAYAQPKRASERPASSGSEPSSPVEPTATATASGRDANARVMPGPRSFIEVLNEARRRDVERSAASHGGALDARSAMVSRERLRAASPAPEATSGRPPHDPRGADLTGGNEPLVRGWLDRTLQMEDQVRRLLVEAGRGRTFSAGELIALQATAFRYAQTIEVLSRAVDRVVGGVKQALGTPV